MSAYDNVEDVAAWLRHEAAIILNEDVLAIEAGGDTTPYRYRLQRAFERGADEIERLRVRLRQERAGIYVAGDE